MPPDGWPERRRGWGRGVLADTQLVGSPRAGPGDLGAGAVSCPIAPFYREHELRQVIEQVRPAAVVSAETFRGFGHAEAFDDLLATVGLDDVARIVLRGTRPGWSSFDAVVSHGGRQRSADVGPDEPCLILFTSGTTSGAKAAVHSSRTLLAETRQLPMRGACPGRTSRTWRPRCSTSPACSTR